MRKSRSRSKVYRSSNTQRNRSRSTRRMSRRRRSSSRQQQQNYFNLMSIISQQQAYQQQQIKQTLSKQPFRINTSPKHPPARHTRQPRQRLEAVKITTAANKPLDKLYQQQHNTQQNTLLPQLYSYSTSSTQQQQRYSPQRQYKMETITTQTDNMTEQTRQDENTQTEESTKQTLSSQTEESPKQTEGSQTESASKQTEGTQTEESPKQTEGSQTEESTQPTESTQFIKPPVLQNTKTTEATNSSFENVLGELQQKLRLRQELPQITQTNLQSTSQLQITTNDISDMGDSSYVENSDMTTNKTTLKPQRGIPDVPVIVRTIPLPPPPPGKTLLPPPPPPPPAGVLSQQINASSQSSQSSSQDLFAEIRAANRQKLRKVEKNGINNTTNDVTPEQKKERELEERRYLITEYSMYTGSSASSDGHTFSQNEIPDLIGKCENLNKVIHEYTYTLLYRQWVNALRIVPENEPLKDKCKIESMKSINPFELEDVTENTFIASFNQNEDLIMTIHLYRYDKNKEKHVLDVIKLITGNVELSPYSNFTLSEPDQNASRQEKDRYNDAINKYKIKNSVAFKKYKDKLTEADTQLVTVFNRLTNIIDAERTKNDQIINKFKNISNSQLKNIIQNIQKLRKKTSDDLLTKSGLIVSPDAIFLADNNTNLDHFLKMPLLKTPKASFSPTTTPITKMPAEQQQQIPLTLPVSLPTTTTTSLSTTSKPKSSLSVSLPTPIPTLSENDTLLVGFVNRN